MTDFRSRFNDLKAPSAESEAQNPSLRRLSTDDYLQMLANQFGDVASSMQQMTAALKQAEAREATVRFTVDDFATLKSVPTGVWSYVLVNRPGIGEDALTTLYPYELRLGNSHYFIPNIGLFVVPYLNEAQVGIFATKLGTSPTPTGNWSVEVIFTNRKDIQSIIQANLSGITLGAVTVTSGSIAISNAPIPVVGTNGSLTSRSGVLTVANVSQQMMAANLLRKFLLIANDHGTEDLWIAFGAGAAVQSQPSLRMSGYTVSPNCQLLLDGLFVPTQAVQVIATTLHHGWTAFEA